jgi:hypothetical protein
MPAARGSDPWTSWAAARSLPDLRARQAAVLWLLQEHFPEGGTLEQLVWQYQGLWRARVARAGAGLPTVPAQSDSGIRTRCRELQDLGLAHKLEETALSSSGRPAHLVVAGPPPPMTGEAFLTPPPPPIGGQLVLGGE